MISVIGINVLAPLRCWCHRQYVVNVWTVEYLFREPHVDRATENTRMGDANDNPLFNRASHEFCCMCAFAWAVRIFFVAAHPWDCQINHDYVNCMCHKSKWILWTVCLDFTDLTLWQLELPNHLSHHKFVRLLLPLVVSEVAYYHSKEAGHYAPHFDWGQLGNWWREAFGGQMESKDGTATPRQPKYPRATRHNNQPTWTIQQLSSCHRTCSRSMP